MTKYYLWNQYTKGDDMHWSDKLAMAVCVLGMIVGFIFLGINWVTP